MHPAEVQLVGPHAVAHDRHGDEEDEHAVQLVRQPLAVRELHALLANAGEDEVERDAVGHPAEEHRARLGGEERHPAGGGGECARQVAQVETHALVGVTEEHEGVAHEGKTDDDGQRARRAHELVVHLLCRLLRGCRRGSLARGGRSHARLATRRHHSRPSRTRRRDIEDTRIDGVASSRRIGRALEGVGRCVSAPRVRVCAPRGSAWSSHHVRDSFQRPRRKSRMN